MKEEISRAKRDCNQSLFVLVILVFNNLQWTIYGIQSHFLWGEVLSVNN